MTECNVILCEEQNYLCHSDFSGGNIPAHFDKIVLDTQEWKRLAFRRKYAPA